MDWPKARAILMVAFVAVNLVLVYSIWGPAGWLPGITQSPESQLTEQLRATLEARDLTLPSPLSVPRTPDPLRFLYVEFRTTPTLDHEGDEPSSRDAAGRSAWMNPFLDSETLATVYMPRATGAAAREIRLDNRQYVLQVVDEFLLKEELLPAGSAFLEIRPLPKTENLLVEYVPFFEGLPVFSGYTRVEVSARGIETVSQFRVEPRGYTTAAPKAVRPVSEALLRLAGRLEAAGGTPRTVTDIRLGYYAGGSLTVTQTDDIDGWDTVPVWRITLDNGAVYYINAFNGEWES